MLIKIGFVFCHSIFQWTIDSFLNQDTCRRDQACLVTASTWKNIFKLLHANMLLSDIVVPNGFSCWFLSSSWKTLRIPEVKTMDLQHHLSSNLPTKTQRGRLNLNWWEPNGFWGENHKPFMADSEILNAWKRSTPPITARIRKVIF